MTGCAASHDPAVRGSRHPGPVTAPDRHGWIVGPAGVPYPPEPWYLGGSLLLSVFRVPLAGLPDAALACVPPDHALLAPGGAVPVGVACVRYEPGGVLAYDELLVALPVRCGIRVRCSVPWIWVSSASSMHGGRELWGIPKEIGEFTGTVNGPAVRTALRHDGREVAGLAAATGQALLPGRPRVPLATAQLLGGRRRVAHNLLLGRVRAVRTRWWFAPDGPLGFLAGRSPLFGVALTEAAVVFGLRVERSGDSPRR